MLYQDHFKFRTLEGQPIAEKNIQLPEPLIKKDEHGDTKIYKDQAEILVSLDKADSGLRVQYQGCGEVGFLLPADEQGNSPDKTALYKLWICLPKHLMPSPPSQHKVQHRV